MVTISGLAGAVGQAVIAEAEHAAGRYHDLFTLVEACRDTGTPASAGEDQPSWPRTLGAAALTAQWLCAEPARLGELSPDEQRERLFALGLYLTYLADHDATRLAPLPASTYPALIAQMTDGEHIFAAWRAATAVILEVDGPTAYEAAAAELEARLAGHPAAARFAELTERMVTVPPTLVGASLLAEAEQGGRRHPDLSTLIQSALTEDVAEPADEEKQRLATGLGMVALAAAGLCDRVDQFDLIPVEARDEMLQAFQLYLGFVLERKVWHLAPQPLTAYPKIITRYTDPAARAEAAMCAASVVRESGDLTSSLDILLSMDGHLAAVPPELVSTIHLHAGNTLRDLRRIDEAYQRYELAERAVPEHHPQAETVHREIRHQRHRLSFYTGNPERDLEFDPNPFKPGSVYRDPQSWRDQPWQLLTLVQNARALDDCETAHRGLTELAAAARPGDYELIAMVHHEAAEVASLLSSSVETVRWHGLLSVCATILSGSLRELAGRLSRQATRLATYGDHLAAYNVARWALAGNRVPLYSADIRANVGYVLYRNGSLELARNHFDQSLSDQNSDLVRAQRQTVEVLTGEPAPPANAYTGNNRNVVRWHAAARLLAAPARDLHTWSELLRYSKGSLATLSPSLHTLVLSFQPLPDGPPTVNQFGNTPIDDVKGRLYQFMVEQGLLGTLDRLWNIPLWASVAWALSGPLPAAVREQIGLAIAAAPTIGLGLVTAARAVVDQPVASLEERREAVAQIERLLALTFLPADVAAGFGGPAVAADLRVWAAAFLQRYGDRLAYRVVDVPDEGGAEIERRTHQFLAEVAQLPPHLRQVVAEIGALRQLANAGPVRSIRDLELAYLSRLNPSDAFRVRELLDRRVQSTDLLTSHSDWQRTEVRGWSDSPGHVTVDLIQGPDALHLVVTRPAGRRTVTVISLPVSRLDAHAAVQRSLLATVTNTVTQVVTAVRDATRDATEAFVRLREPWEATPVENLAGAGAPPLSDTLVVVRRHSDRPRFGIAVAALPRRAEVLGDPKGESPVLGLPGAFAEAHGVAAAFGCTPYVRDGANWDQLRKCARTAELLWISTHCEAVSDLGDTPALCLHDRWVLPSEIAAMSVRPGAVVVLTVCAGGRSVALGNVSEPPLAAAFLTAGASLVISTVRPIRDTIWGPRIVDALRHTLTVDATPVALVRTLNASTPKDEATGPWIMHA